MLSSDSLSFIKGVLAVFAPHSSPLFIVVISVPLFEGLGGELYSG